MQNNNRARQQREQRTERAARRESERQRREIEAARVERDQEIQAAGVFQERQREFREREQRQAEIALENLQIQDPVPTRRPRRRREVVRMSDEVRTLYNRAIALTSTIVVRLAQNASRTETRPLEQELLNIYTLIRDRVDPRDTVSPGILDRYINQLKESLNESNPSQLQVVPAPDPVPEIMSKSYPDNKCNICLEPVVGEGCRVNCPAGHIYHCECINEWRNTRAGNEYHDTDWQNGCPYCRQQIDSMYYVDIPEGFTTEFGKRKSTTTKSTEKKQVSLKNNKTPKPSVSRSKVVKRKKRRSGNDVVVGDNIIEQVVEGDIDKIKMLINSGVNLNVVNRSGKTPLIIAIDQEKPEIAELLIKNGADVNLAETKFGKTPLIAAIIGIDWIDDNSMYSKFLSLIETLLKYGADVNKATYDGITPISIATNSEDENIKKIVLGQSTSFGKKRKSTPSTKMSLVLIKKYIKYLNKL